MRMVRGILIDPFEKTITEVQCDADDYKEIYRLIEASPFDLVRLNDFDVIFVDDEGLYRENQKFFKWEYYHQPLAGKGLILGGDEEGETQAAKISLEAVKEAISWCDVELAGFEDVSGTVDHPVLGPNTPMIGHRPLFRHKETPDGEE